MKKSENRAFKKRSQLSLIWHRLSRNKLAMVGLLLMTIILGLAFCADLIADYIRLAVK